MAAANERFVEAARGLGMEPEYQTYPDGTRTAVDAAAAVGCDVGQIVKSLVFMGDDKPVLALTSGANRVDTKLLAAAAGVAKIRQANADQAREATGFAIGGTPPFGHPSSLVTLIDQDLLAWPTVWAAAGTPDTCFPITPDRLVEVANAQPAVFAEGSDPGAGP